MAGKDRTNGRAGQGRIGLLAEQGRAGKDIAWQGGAGQGRMQGKTGHGMAGQGKAGKGMAEWGKEGKDRMVMA